MDFDEYQEKALRTAVYPNRGKNVFYPALGLGEAGEIQNKVKKIMRDDGFEISDERRDSLADEIGDLLWYVAVLADELKLKLNDIAEANIKKLSSRALRGKIHGDGDKR